MYTAAASGKHQQENPHTATEQQRYYLTSDKRLLK